MKWNGQTVTMSGKELAQERIAAADAGVRAVDRIAGRLDAVRARLADSQGREVAREIELAAMTAERDALARAATLSFFAGRISLTESTHDAAEMWGVCLGSDNVYITFTTREEAEAYAVTIKGRARIGQVVYVDPASLVPDATHIVEWMEDHANGLYGIDQERAEASDEAITEFGQLVGAWARRNFAAQWRIMEDAEPAGPPVDGYGEGIRRLRLSADEAEAAGDDAGRARKGFARKRYDEALMWHGLILGLAVEGSAVHQASELSVATIRKKHAKGGPFDECQHCGIVAVNGVCAAGWASCKNVRGE